MTNSKRAEIITAILVGAACGLAKSVVDLIAEKRQARERVEELKAMMAVRNIGAQATLDMEQEFEEAVNRLVERSKKEGDDIVKSFKESFEPFRLNEETEETKAENDEA